MGCINWFTRFPNFERNFFVITWKVDIILKELKKSGGLYGYKIEIIKRKTNIFRR